jgi:hypothetical protein
MAMWKVGMSGADGIFSGIKLVRRRIERDFLINPAAPQDALHWIMMTSM